MKSICQINDCDKPMQARGWCRMHYMRWYHHGDPSVVSIEMGKNLKWLEEIAVRFVGDECLSWPFDRNAKGYGRVTLAGRRRAAHRVVCEIVRGPAPTGLYDAAHSCGNGHLACVNPRHIRWATRQENILEKNDHGTMARGIRNGNVSMTEETARAVKRMIGSMTQKSIAAKLGITRSAVRDIKLGKSWAWL
jgi:hypothetical protein